MKKMISLLALFILTAALLVGCAQDEAIPTFTHGIYEVGYETAVSQTNEGVPAVEVNYKYYVRGGKKVKDVSSIGLVFGGGGLYGVYLKVNGLAYPVSSVSIDHINDNTAAVSVVEVPGVTETSIFEVCSAGLDAYVERGGNRIYYAPYLLGQLAENGSRQVLIDLAYINGMDTVRKDGQISGPCADFSEEINRIMADAPFIVSVGGTEYTANSLTASIYGADGGSLAIGRLMLVIDVPANTPVDTPITVR